MDSSITTSVEIPPSLYEMHTICSVCHDPISTVSVLRKPDGISHGLCKRPECRQAMRDGNFAEVRARVQSERNLSEEVRHEAAL
jgi:hypothetical protein